MSRFFLYFCLTYSFLTYAQTESQALKDLYAKQLEEANHPLKKELKTPNLDANASALVEKAYLLIDQSKTDELHLLLASQEAQKIADIQLLIGVFYHDGIFYDQDYTKAARWLEKAANQGDSKAQTLLANLYFHGKGVEKNLKKGNEWLEKALAQNYSGALAIQADRYYAGDSVPKNLVKAFELYQQAASDDVYAQFQLGIMYLHGDGIAQNYTSAFKWLTKAAEQNFMNAQFDLGLMYFNGEGVKIDRALGCKYIQLAAEQGMPTAQFALGRIFLITKPPQYRQKAKEWFTKAANQGNEEAKMALKKL